MIVELPNGQELEFPDGTSQDVMRQAISKHFPEYAPKNKSQPAQNNKTGWAGVLQDALSGAKSTPGQLKDIATNLPSQLYDSADLAIHHTLRAAGDVGAGLLEGMKGLANTPYNISKYLQSKGILDNQNTDDFLKKYGGFDSDTLNKIRDSAHIGDTGLQKSILGESQKGDEFLQGIGSFLPYSRIGSLGEGIGGIAKRAGAGALYGIGQNENPITNALTGASAEGITRGVQKIVKPENFLPSSPLSNQQLLSALEQAKGTEANLGNVIQNPFLKKTFENVLAETPLSGANPAMQRTAKILQDRGSNILDNLKGTYDTSDIGSTLQSALQNAEKDTRTEKNNRFNKLNDAAEKAGVTTDRSKLREAAREEWSKIQDDPDLARLTDPATKKLLKETAETTSKNNSLKKTDLLRAKLGEKARDSYSNGNSELGGIYAKLRDASLDDINSAIDSKKADHLTNLRDDAMSYYKKEWLPFEDKDITKFTREGGDADTLVQSFIRNSKLSDRSNLLKKLTEKLNPEEKNLLAHSYLSNAVDENGFNPLKMNTLYKNLGDRTKQTLFGKDSELKKNLDDYTNFVGKNSEAINLMLNPKTGARAGAFPWLASTGGVLTSLASGNLPAGLAVGALPILAARPAVKALTNQTMREKIINSMIKARSKNSLSKGPGISPYIQNVVESSNKNQD